MVFSDPIFLFLFLPLFVLAANLVPRGGFVVLACLGSLLFYFFGSGIFVALFAASAVGNWAVSLYLQDGKRPAWLLPLAVGANLAVIGYFKYAFFLATNVGDLIGVNLEGDFDNIYLPIGISFFTFQAISYLVDVARGVVTPPRNPLIFMAYLAFFPQLIAGPIVRYSDVHDQFAAPAWTGSDMFYGLTRFLHGLGKKLIIADTAGKVADACFGLPPDELGFSAAWIGALAYAIQIYFDFSGYSDMAIGIGRMFGIRFPENFNHPYSATSIADFWRRWHISLSTFFRDYVYIPLGGNRGSATSTYRNLVIVFFLTGVWHGAAWHFVIWGLYNGAFLILERLVPRIGRAGHRTFANGLYVTFVVVFGWVMFRSETVLGALAYWRVMLIPTGLGAPLPEAVARALDPITASVLAASMLVFLAPRSFTIGARLAVPGPARNDYAVVAYGIAIGCVAFVLAFARPFSPFLYFQF